MIAVDWGTSNFRAFRIDATGAVTARCSSPLGILQVGAGNFEEALRTQVGRWLQEGDKQILLSGMVGSRQGWVEAPYLTCPVGIEELAAAVVPVPFFGAQVLLIPGVMEPDALHAPEVMRGEETAAMGTLDDCSGSGVVCFPGTHSKWIQIRDRRIISFTTSMTGDVYSALSRCTILERTVAGQKATDTVAFHEGVVRSGDPGGLLHHLFGVRTRVLLGKLRQEASASYLSGLLIGHEIRAAMPKGAEVLLAGAAHLCGLYADAIASLGGKAKLAHENAAALGMAAIGRRLSWR